MKNIQLSSVLFLIFCSMIHPLSVEAQTQVLDPFIVTQSINQELIDKDQCYRLIRTHTTAVDTSSNESQLILDEIALLQEALESTQLSYQSLNTEIALLESGEEDSLVFANQQLNQVIELLYYDALESDADFALLSEEEQLALIGQHEVVLEWQDFISQLQQFINQKVLARDAEETYYYQLTYELENQGRLLEEEKFTQAQLNQCLLYPYSTSYLAAEQLLLNTQSPQLDNFLLEIDHYLQKLVPNAFRKIAYYDIYRMFTLPSDNDTQVIEWLANKETTVVDDLAQYSYAKELNLYDLEVLGNYAKSAYYKYADLEALTDSYLSALNIKEAQFQYFHQLNAEIFAELAGHLANYLNLHRLTDGASLEKIQTLHNRYQLKLVFYDDETVKWSPNSFDQSGYYVRYQDLSLTEAQAIDSKTGNPIEPADQLAGADDEESSINSQSSRRSSLTDLLPLPDETDTPANNGDGLDFLKDQLTNGTHSNVKSDQLPKPGKLDTSKESSADKSNSKLSLPHTGESARWTLLGTILLVVACVLLLINQIIKRKKREKLEEIELD